MNTESIFPVLLELLAKSAVIALAATLLLRAWRDVTAAQRHLVWFVALAIVTLLPLTRLVSPRWAIAIQPARKVTMTMPALSPIPMETVETDSAPREAATPMTVHSPLDWRKIILGCWFTGMIGVLVRRFAGSWRLRRLLARGLPLNDERVRAMSDRIFQELGIRRHPDVRLSAECRVPITWGVFRPRMLLPVASLEWSDTWLIAALRHESAHIRRHDYLARWVAQIACAIYWPNPFVWLLARSLRLAQEQAADDLVLRSGTPAEEYATQLVDAARTVAKHGFFVRQAVAMACPSTLEYRVRAIVDERSSRRPLSMLAASLGSFSAVIVLGLCAVAQLRSEDATSPEASPSQVDREPGPIVEIEARFLNIPPEVLKADPPVQFDQPMQVFSDPQFQIIMRFLGQKPSVNLFSTPRVTTQSKQRVEARATREFRYAKDWEKNSEGWKATAFATKELGVTLDATPDVQADGTVALKVNAKVTDLAGYEDLDHPGEIDTEHGRAEARFSQGQIEQTATLKTGETVLLTGLRQWVDGKPSFQWIDGKPRKDSERLGRLYVFVRARILQPVPMKDGEARSQSAAQQAPAENAAGAPGKLTENTSEQLDRVDRLVAEKVAASPTTSEDVTAPAAAEDGPTLAKAKSIIIPKIELREAALPEVLEFLRAKAKELDPEKTGVNLVLKPGATSDARITVSLVNIPLLEALHYVVSLANFEYQVQPNAIVIQPSTGKTGTNDGGAQPAPISPQSANPMPREEGPALAKGRAIIIPKIEFRDATMAEALEYLRARAKELDPEKTGVNFVVKPGATSDARITLSLTNVPLLEAVHYVVGLADLEFQVQADAIVIQPAKAKAVTSTDGEQRSSNANTAPITAGANNNDGLTKTGTGTLMLSGINTDKGNIKGNVIVSGGITDLPGHGNAPAGTLVLDGGVLRLAEDSPQSAGAAKGTGAVESVKVKEEAAVPVEITSDSSRMENGIALAEGNAVLKWGEAAMKADHIRYDPTTRQLDLTGNVEVKTGTSVQKAERMTLWLTPDGRMKTAGPHTTTLLAPPAAGPPGSATANVGTSPVAVTLAPKGTFKDNDGIEIRETTGTTPTFRVGGTYHVRGVCRQSSLEHAMLLISNTADSDGEAIKPVDGATLSREIPKGHTEFEFAFTPTRPGKLHVTIYNTDNHNPADNAYAGIYLGEVTP